MCMLTFFVFAIFFYFCSIFYKCVCCMHLFRCRDGQLIMWFEHAHDPNNGLQSFCNLSYLSPFSTPIPPPPVFVVSLYVTAHNELVIASCHCRGTVKCYCTHHVKNTFGGGGDSVNHDALWVASVLVIRLVYVINRQLWVYTVCTLSC